MRRFDGLSTLLEFFAHPLVLVGVIIALFFGVLTELIESGVFPQLAQGDAAPIVHKLLDYGLIVGLVVIVLGFGLQFYKLSRGIPLVAPISEKAATLEQRNRQRMLERVRHMWVEGVLEQSLYQVARIELGFSEEPEAIDHPWKLVVEQPEHAPRLLRDGTPMHTVFEQFDKTLLLLGAPGSGKTTLLLELARELIEWAKEDTAHPIPVVLNLSSWVLQRPSIAAWLVDELNKRYDVPRKVAQQWVKNDQILPLLDGLDEVAQEHREACVEAINAFRKEHGLLPLVVCSRSTDYAALSKRLRLPGAVTIQPLTRKQIEQYLGQAGTALSGMRAAVRDDETLWELLDTPLMLSILALAYQGGMPSRVQITKLKGSLEQRRAVLFDAYIEAMFTRRDMAAPYTSEQTRHWLSWLAQAMGRHDQTVFYLERIQPDWLPKAQVRLYQIGTGLVFGLGGGLVGGFGGWLVNGLVGGLVGGLGVGLIGGLRGGLFSGLVGGRTAEFFTALDDGIQPVEAIHLAWKEVRRWLGIGLVAGLFLGVLFGLVGELVGELGVGYVGELGYGLFVWLFVWLYMGLFGGLLMGLDIGLVADEIPGLPIPNEGIRRSLRIALGVGLVAGGFGLFFGMKKGGYACIQHGVLRVLLSRYDYAPLNYVRFLEHAKNQLFLLRVGGGYLFLHRLFMERFAELAVRIEDEEARDIVS